MTRRELLAVLALGAPELGGRGCVIRRGRTVEEWGDQAERRDVLSSAKPVMTTLLFFAIVEGKLHGLEERIGAFGWDLSEKDRTMTFAHLTSMTSGYGRPEAPGEAWAYNDFAINLYQKTLFDRVFRETPEAVGARLGNALGLEDGLAFRATNRRLSASVRDFARIAEFWRNKGKWKGRRILPERLFERYCRPQTNPGLSQTAKAETSDYLKIGTYGGGSDHFTEYGAGIYGGNWWFNGIGRLHPKALTWPDAPRDTFMSIGAGGNCAMMIPSRQLTLVAMGANWGKLEPGNADSLTNQHIVNRVRE
ncbi:MAG: serine hydrolase [Acidobacteria bacterium]|nr:serine hydrolase [Acidobacteriota bacterium]